MLHAFQDYPWPGNVAQLQDVVREAARQTHTIELRHLPPEILSSSTRRLSRIEVFERDEIIRVLTQEGITMQCAADELRMSRATIYRKLAHFDIRLPARTEVRHARSGPRGSDRHGTATSRAQTPKPCNGGRLRSVVGIRRRAHSGSSPARH